MEIQFNNKFHEKLCEDDPVRLKHVANVQNKTNSNTVTVVIYYKFVVVKTELAINYSLKQFLQTSNI